MQYDAAWVEQTLASLTLDEKIGQVLMTSQFDWSEATVNDMEGKLRRFQPAGFFHMGGTPEQLLAGVPRLAAATRIPPLMASDFESGVGHMMPCGTRLPRPMARGHAGTAKSEYELGRITAEESVAIGTGLSFSPVIDLNTHPLNPDVNVRAYGETLRQVLRLAVPHVRGMQEHGLLATVKHFPGNGDTAMDQHLSPALVPTPAAKFRRLWLEAYRRLFAEADPAAVMVSYLTVPSIMSERDPATGELLPACLSREMLQGLLRGKLAYEGLIISDALNMGGGLCFYPRGVIAAKALVAGVDLLLCFSGMGDLQPEFDAIRAALDSGELSAQRLDDAVRRVLVAKAKAGLDRRRSSLLAGADQLRSVLQPKTELVRRELRRGLTLLSNRAGQLPLRGVEGKRVLVLNTYSPSKELYFSRGESFPRDLVEQGLRARGALVESMDLGESSPENACRTALAKAAEADLCFFNFFVVPSYAIGTLVPHREAVRVFFGGLQTIGRQPPVITVFGDPYQRQFCHTAPTFLCTFDDTRESMELALQAWFGEIPLRGRMPVSMPGLFKRGDGLDLEVRGSPEH